MWLWVPTAVAVVLAAIGVGWLLRNPPNWGSDLEWECPPEWQPGAPDTLPGERAPKPGECLLDECECATGNESQRAEWEYGFAAPAGAATSPAAGKGLTP